MPSENGYVSLWRDINAQPWANDVFYYGVFTKLMTFVQHKPYLATVNGIQIPLQAGEIAMSYSDIAAMFKQIKNKEHARNIIRKFESLDQIYKREVKKDGVHYGFVIGLKGWKKWQNLTTPLTTPPTPPEAANLKALDSDENTPSTTPLTIQKNNNVLQEEKSMYVSGETNAPVEKDFLEERKDLFQAFWSEWLKCKKLVGVKNNATKSEASKKFLNHTMPASKVRRLGIESAAIEVDKIIDFAWTEHEALKADLDRGIKGFHPIQNMHPPKFLGQKGWEDNA